MIENLLLLHDSHYGRLYQKLAVFLDLHLCGFLFNLLFSFQWNVYVDAVLFAVETKRKEKIQIILEIFVIFFQSSVTIKTAPPLMNHKIC